MDGMTTQTQQSSRSAIQQASACQTPKQSMFSWNLMTVHLVHEDPLNASLFAEPLRCE